MSDTHTRTALGVPPMQGGPGDPELELEEISAIPEEQTIQGASFLVERITPVPPLGEERRLVIERERILQAAMTGAPMDAPTAALQNPGPRPPASMRTPEPVGEMLKQASPPGLAGRGEAPPIAEPATWASAASPSEVPPDVDTAYVPLPGGGQAPGPGPAQAPALTPLRAPTQTAAVRIAARLRSLQGLPQRIKDSKNARLAILAGGGLLGVLLTFVLFSPKRVPERPPEPEETQVQQPVNEAPAAVQPAAPADPARIKERDILLEKGVLAVEAGRTDEALAIFRRYAEEQSDPTAEFMVQLLQLQISQSGKER